jgi:hypothetical protein
MAEKAIWLNNFRKKLLSIEPRSAYRQLLTLLQYRVLEGDSKSDPSAYTG